MIFEFIADKKIDIKTLLLNNGFSLREINRLILEGKNIFINDNVYKSNFMLNKNDKLKIIIYDTTTVKPIDIPINIVFEDEYFLVVNKPKNLSTIPSIAHYEDNLSSRVVNYFQKTNQQIGIHIVNRLDYLTCGLVIFAKSSHIHFLMSRTIIEKKYIALVSGHFTKKEGTITAKIDRINNSIKRQVSENGKEAITNYKVIKEFNDNSLVDIALLTGRTHQIRVHFAYISHPLVDDSLYNKKSTTTNNFFLCAYSLNFHFPLNNKDYNFEIKDFPEFSKKD